MSNKTAIITGGAAGIGKACAHLLSDLSYNVVISYNTSESAGKALAASLQNCIAIKTDVRDSSDVKALIDTAISTFGSVDVLINNAAISQQKLFCDITDADFDDMLAVNVKGVFNACKFALPHMIAKKQGKIVNISSMWGQVGASCEVHYSASKAAVIGFTKALAKEVGLSGINVNCICPGVIDTAMNDCHDAQTIASLLDDTPLNRLGTPLEVASLVAFLISEQSSFITGQIIGINGGMII